MPGMASSAHRMHGVLVLAVNLFVPVHVNPVREIETNH